MATTATVSITSSDITSSGTLGVSHNKILKKAATSTDLDVMEQGVRTSATAATITVLDADLSGASWTANGSNKVFITNPGASTTDYWTIKLDSSEAEEVGRLYGGDWMFIPWAADSADDITATSSQKDMTLEYIVFADKV